MWTEQKLKQIFMILKKAPELLKAPVYEFMSQVTDGSFKILIATILSLRTKDETTGPASRRLFDIADSPEKMLSLTITKIEELIYPVGFYKNKAKQIKKISQILLDVYDGSVPNDLDLLLELPGVGRKTANLVLSVAFDKPAVCVDVHVHRISNRWGFCTTKTPEETEFYIRDHVSQELWSQFNRPMVALGQVICRPISPKCVQCPIQLYCAQHIN
ncbi:MAG: endonuclease III domain-containing protein [Brevinema sp.]